MSPHMQQIVYGMKYRATSQVCGIAHFFRFRRTEFEDTKIFANVRYHVLSDTASQPRRPESPAVSLWDRQSLKYREHYSNLKKK